MRLKKGAELNWVLKDIGNTLIYLYGQEIVARSKTYESFSNSAAFNQSITPTCVYRISGVVGNSFRPR